MRNTSLIIRHEISTTLRRRSFWLTTFLLPAFVLVLSLGSQSLARSSLATGGSNPLFKGALSASQPMGYVDQAGVIQNIPERPADRKSWRAGPLQAYPDQAAAQAALEAGQISRYYVVASDFMTTGNVVVVDGDFSVFNSLENNDYFEYALRFNLASDAQLALLLDDPTASLKSQAVVPPHNAKTDDFAGFGVPMAVLFIFYFVITMSSGFMLQSVSKEKENRTIEVLLLSVRPRELMLGKVLGLGVVALVQVAVWGGGGLLVGGGLPGGSLDLSEGFIVWALSYFVLGYLLYSSLMGAVGAIAPSAREGSKFTFLVMIPLFVPLILNSALIEAPNGPLSVFLSLFPLTSPVAMLARLAATSVPIAQLLLGLALLAITTYALVVLASRFFRADTLLSFNALNLRTVLHVLKR